MALAFTAACGESGGAIQTTSADAAIVDAASPDAFIPREHEPTTAEGIAYFADIDKDLVGAELVSALYVKLKADHVEISFAGLFDAYEITDTGRGGCTGIFDFYSNACWTPEQACGNYEQEGDCFNREHSWPKSWWGGGTGPEQHQDLFAVIPADGYVNNLRGNLPLGEVLSPSYTSSNSSRVGSCDADGEGALDSCFEPTDELKGDFARIYFYMAVRYQAELGCCSELVVDGADLRPFFEELLRRWHVEDAVDVAEQERNEKVFGIQGNRNPFVDYPVFVDQIADF